MEITHEIREYIIVDDGVRYSVRHNVGEDCFFVYRIEENESHPDRNSIVHFDVPSGLMDRIRGTISMSKGNGTMRLKRPAVGVGLLGRLLCGIGFHRFTSDMQDCIDEFGFIPNDGRMPKSAKCSRCGAGYR